jgi:Tol biopolymer transport system component
VNFFLPQPSRDGKTIFAIGQQLGSELVRFNVHSKVFLPYLGGISATSVVISPDERWAAYVAYPEGTLWRCRVDGSERQRLTESTMKVERPHWSPDGSQIAFVASPRGSPSSGFVVSANGGPITRILPDGGIGSLWSNDGTKIAFNYFEHGKSADDRDWVQIRIMDLGTKKISLVPHSEGLFLADWSRDGKFLLAKTSDHHRGLLFEVSTEQWTMFREAEMLTNLRFSRNADYIYFESTSANHAALMRMRIADHKIEQVMDFQNIRRPLTQLSSAWTGLANDDSPIMQRDIGTQEVYALHWRVP